MLVKSILDHPPTTAEPSATIGSVASIMRSDGMGAVVILDKDRLVGIVTDRDVALRVGDCNVCAQTRPISKIMTHNPLTCFDDQNVEEAAMIMADNQVRYLPVINHTQDLVGLLTIDVIAENYSERLAGETLGEIVEHRRSNPVTGRTTRINDA